MPNSSEHVLVYMTARDTAEADRLAEVLVERGLASGVNMVDGRSVYRWRGEVCRHSEVLLVAQTTSARFAELEQTVRNLHSYEVPCVIALPMVQASDAFARWISMNAIPPSNAIPPFTEY